MKTNGPKDHAPTPSTPEPPGAAQLPTRLHPSLVALCDACTTTEPEETTAPGLEALLLERADRERARDPGEPMPAASATLADCDGANPVMIPGRTALESHVLQGVAQGRRKPFEPKPLQEWPFRLVWEYEVTDDDGATRKTAFGFRGKALVYVDPRFGERTVTPAESLRLHHENTLKCDGNCGGAEVDVDLWFRTLESAIADDPRPLPHSLLKRQPKDDFNAGTYCVCRQWARSPSRADVLSWARDRLKAGDVPGAIRIIAEKRARKDEVLETLVFGHWEPAQVVEILRGLRDVWGWQGRAVVGGQ